jgi:hypothetical protein
VAFVAAVALGRLTVIAASDTGLPFLLATTSG